MVSKSLLFLVGLAMVILMSTSSSRAQWVQTSVPDDQEGLSFASNDSVLFAGTSAGLVFESHDNGLTWTSFGSDFSDNGDVFSLLISDTSLFAGTRMGVFRTSLRNGSYWTSIGYKEMGAGAFVFSLLRDGNDLFAGTGGYPWTNIERSTDSGTHWAPIDNGLSPTAADVHALGIMGTIIFAGAEGVYRSSDSGTKWNSTSSGLPPFSVFALLSDGQNIFAGVEAGGIYRSTDSGMSWQPTNNGLTRNSVESLAAIDQYIFAGVNTGGVCLSTNHGMSWTSVGLINRDVISLCISGPTIFAGTDSGVWRRPLSEMIGSNAVTENVSAKLSLSSYPNPFSETTTISFQSASSGYADISIVNLLGTEVAKIFSGELSSGEQHFTWEPSGLPAGMYECLVRMNGRVENLPVMLTR